LIKNEPSTTSTQEGLFRRLDKVGIDEKRQGLLQNNGNTVVFYAMIILHLPEHSSYTSIYDRKVKFAAF
jgi:hypothetical protein